MDMTGAGELIEEDHRGEVEVVPLGRAQGLEIGHVQLVETTTLPGDQPATNALSLNKQTRCQSLILAGVIIQAMEQIMAMAMARSHSVSKCYLVCVCCDLVSHFRHGCVKGKSVALVSPRYT